MSTQKDRENATTWAQETLIKLGCSAICNRFQIEWNSRFTWKMGLAHTAMVKMYPYIELSSALWPYATETEKYETVVHEVCHIANAYKTRTDPSYVDDGGHGESWKKLMIACGVPPNRCHNVKSPIDLPGKNKRFEGKCKCKTWQLTQNRITRMKRGVHYFCKTCNTTITIAKSILKQT